jgi:gluconokinase
MVIVLMGAAGAGKTTLGKALAAELGWPFVEGDDYHTPEHIAQMRRGEPLTDAERAPWLELLHEVIARAIERRESLVIACSALKARYRDVLAGGLKPVRFVHLTAETAVLRERLAARQHHFAGPALLESQLASLEVPVGVLTLDTSKDLAISLGRVHNELGV